MNDAVDDFLNETETVGPAIATVMRGAMRNITDALLPLLTDDLPEDLGCQKLSDEVVQPMLDVFCGDMMNAAYWMVASWYMVGLAVCVCGYPAMFLGYKRFPNELWGPYYLQRKDHEAYLEYERTKGCCGGGGAAGSSSPEGTTVRYAYHTYHPPYLITDNAPCPGMGIDCTESHSSPHCCHVSESAAAFLFTPSRSRCP